MADIAVLALVMATLGQVALCISILLVRSLRTQVYLPLAVFFTATGIITAEPAVATFWPALRTHFIAMLLPAYLLLGPALWLYVEGLTSETVWQLRARHGRHLLSFGLGLIAAGLIMALPLATRRSIFVNGDEVTGDYPTFVTVYVFLLILVWIVQSGYYVIRVFHRLTRYRQQLKNLFASNEQRELGWLGWLLMIIGGVWLVSFLSLMSEFFIGNSFIDDRLGTAMSLVLVWSLALWGLRQKPGFEGRYLDNHPEVQSDELADTRTAGKYQRSALSETQARRIAGKIDAAMAQERLYLDPALSLHKLAAQVAISPNYISQTLNETIGESFFDYVNKWRIAAAKPQIQSGDETILAIALAVGFNARSSFYKAFKRETGQTPSEFRNQPKTID